MKLLLEQVQQLSNTLEVDLVQLSILCVKCSFPDYLWCKFDQNKVTLSAYKGSKLYMDTYDECTYRHIIC